MVKNPPGNAGDASLIPGSGRSPGGGHSNPLQCSCLENPMEPGGLQSTGLHSRATKQARTLGPVRGTAVPSLSV